MLKKIKIRTFSLPLPPPNMLPIDECASRGIDRSSSTPDHGLCDHVEAGLCGRDYSHRDRLCGIDTSLRGRLCGIDDSPDDNLCGKENLSHGYTLNAPRLPQYDGGDDESDAQSGRRVLHPCRASTVYDLTNEKESDSSLYDTSKPVKKAKLNTARGAAVVGVKPIASRKPEPKRGHKQDPVDDLDFDEPEVDEETASVPFRRSAGKGKSRSKAKTVKADGRDEPSAKSKKASTTPVSRKRKAKKEDTESEGDDEILLDRKETAKSVVILPPESESEFECSDDDDQQEAIEPALENIATSTKLPKATKKKCSCSTDERNECRQLRDSKECLPKPNTQDWKAFESECSKGSLYSPSCRLWAELNGIISTLWADYQEVLRARTIGEMANGEPQYNFQERSGAWAPIMLRALLASQWSEQNFRSETLKGFPK